MARPARTARHSLQGRCVDRRNHYRHIQGLAQISVVLEGIRNESNRASQSNAVVASGAQHHVSGKPKGAVSRASNSAGTSVRNDGNANRTDGRGTGSVVREGIGNDNRSDAVRSTDSGRLPSVLGARNDSGLEQSSGREGPGETASDVSRNGSDQFEQQRNDVGTEPAPARLERKKAAKSDDGIYTEYAPAQLPIKGSKKHPAPLVDFAAMAAISTPNATYIPNVPSDVITSSRM